VKRILFWVNCYGGWAPEERHPIETIGYSQYLDGVVSAILPISNHVDVIWVSGAMIDSQGRLESETTAAEISRRLDRQGISIEIKTDSESITSMSIARKFLHTWHSEFPDHIGLLTCDQVRYESNMWMLTDLAQQENIEIPTAREILIPLHRVDIHPNSTPEKQAEKLALMREKGIAWVEAEEIKARQG